MDKILRYAAYAGIICLITAIPLLLLEVMGLFGPPTNYLTWASAILISVNGMAGIIVFWGFKILGEKTQNRLLENISLAGIICMFPVTGYSLADTLISLNPMLSLIGAAIALIIIGLLSIVFGIALLKLKTGFGDLATALGAIEILTGITAVTIILSPLTILIGFVASILEVVILWKASNTY